MLTDLLKQIRENPDLFRETIKNRKAKVDVDKILALDKEWRSVISEVEFLRAEQNRISKNKKFSQDELEKAKSMKARIKELEKESKPIGEELDKILYTVPNVPSADVPVGKDASGNQILREVGKKRKFDFIPKDYLTLVEDKWIDIKRAGKISGSRFGYLKGEAVLLEFALVRFAFDVLTSEEIIKKIADSVQKGYSAKSFIPVVPPQMIKPDVYIKMARLSEEDKEERYYIPSDDIYLIGSAEHTLGPLHMDEVIDEADLPVRYCGFSTNFRREAGSYGKDTKGILRVHQFDKVEMETFVDPDNSVLEQNFIVAIQEYLMQSLGIPYRVMMMCTGDMGKPDARQIDIESWMPGQNEYRETHTSDMNTDYQSRRLNTKIRRKDGKLEFVHMNDATAFAIGRTLIAIIENYQQEDGSIEIPKVLKPYMK